MAATPGTLERPLRVAVVGAGPAGFYTVEALLKRAGLHVGVDLFEKLPAPYGLLRYGVAPDHPKIKSVSAAWDRLCEDPRVRYLGNVRVGTGDLSVEELLRCYDQVVFATGCETDRRLGIDGEDLGGSLSATEFVAWYNGHPEFASLPVDLGVERAVVIGIGDVAMDLARILLRDASDLAPTDIADYALEALMRSRVREVVILARRGPRESAFAAKELEDIAELPQVAISLDRELVARELDTTDPHSGHDHHKLEVLDSVPVASSISATRTLEIRFLTSPVSILGENGKARAIRVEKNMLVRDEAGRSVAVGTGVYETIEAGLILRAVGYRGVPTPDLPFDERAGIVPNIDGRVQHENDRASRLYVAGWIKRGPTGVVGTNKADAAATVARMIEDLGSLPPRRAGEVSPEAIDALLAQHSVRVVDWQSWKSIDRRERELGAAAGRTRCKLTTIDDLLGAAGC